jgi:glycerol-3-phosphate dehydrogenase
VVGGGIIGAGVAALAGKLGLDVALVDRADFSEDRLGLEPRVDA